MRFACQSCGKAYNLPEERIADKSNVKLKCRVCGAIVEVKKQGELVAQVLDETEFKHEARVSEAPAPLISIGPEDDDDPEGATVSISEASLNDNGPLEFGFLGTPRAPAPAPGFASSSLPPPPVNRAEGASPREIAGLAPSSPPPPMAPAPMVSASLGSGPGGPPPLRMDAGGELMNGSNGVGHYSLDENLSPRERAGEPLVAPALKPAAARSPAARSPAALSAAALSSAAASLSAAVLSSPGMSATSADVGVTLGSATERGAEPSASNDLYKMMFAAFITGVVVDRIFAGLFF
jgi:hypothetical protein